MEEKKFAQVVPGGVEETKLFDAALADAAPSVKQILTQVAGALKEKGYRPVDQIVGYLITGDPAYITSHKGARLLIKRIERDKILEEVLQAYLDRE
ncbi:MAG TPA: IreB family regulatory phosphoprotein [Firmicutes bacterium]|nr:IreB family regulatory phosphoprotein [Bacillota bacterium]